MIEKSCERCCCVDSEENPIIEIIDEYNCVEEYICMMCYVESLEEDDG